MLRRKGSLNLSSNIEPSMAAPLDARTIADSVEDLTTNGSFPFAYVGMKVFIKATKETYELIDLDPTKLSSWRLFKGEKGDPGAPGEPGAYDIAVQNGFVGTVEEWLQSLHGGPGDGQTVEIDPQLLYTLLGLSPNELQKLKLFVATLPEMDVAIT